MADRTPHIVPDVLETGEDVTRETDRSLILRAVNLGLRANHRLDVIVRGLKLEIRDIRDELAGRPKLDADSSYNVLDATMREAVDTLYARAKDPRDKMDSERARAIAKEVVETARDAADAKELRAWRTRRWSMLLKIVEVLIAAAVGAAAAHYGLQ